MFETMAQFVLGDHLGGRTFDPPIGKPGYERLLTPNRRPYATRDGYVCALIYTDKHWQAFFAALGRLDEFRANPRLADHASRARHYNEVYGMVADILHDQDDRRVARILRALRYSVRADARSRRLDRRSAP